MLTILWVLFECEVQMIFKQFFSIYLPTISLDGLVSCSSSKVTDKPDTKNTASTLSISKKTTNSTNTILTGVLAAKGKKAQLSDYLSNLRESLVYNRNFRTKLGSKSSYTPYVVWKSPQLMCSFWA
jgi:hypothetical protein